MGEFLEVVPDEKLVFTFGWDQPGHPIPAGSTQVAITLISEGEATRVRLVHSGLPDDAMTDHEPRMEHVLGPTATVAVGGELANDTFVDPGPLPAREERS